MKGVTMHATLETLGIRPSHSRPRVSEDNPFSEALFRTLKYRPESPSAPFLTRRDAIAWVAAFVDWYNREHRHSAISFTTPEQRHTGEHLRVLANRQRTYAQAKRRNPERWSGPTRSWSPIE